MKIDTAKNFQHLDRAPVVEAVIEFRARALSAWEEPDITARLKAALPDYPQLQSQSDFTLSVPIALNTGAAPAAQPQPPTKTTAWAGIRATNRKGTQVAAFTRAGLRFSRLPPYTRWSAFTKEALRLWAIHRGLAEAASIERLGVRFINRLTVPTEGLKFGDYFKGLGAVPGGLPVSGFLYHRSIAVPGRPYGGTLIQTIQPPDGPDEKDIRLITDIDIGLLESIPTDHATIKEHLTAMSVLKNTLFFGSVTDKYLALCR